MHFLLVIADLSQDNTQTFYVSRRNFHGTTFLGAPSEFHIFYIRGKIILEQHPALRFYLHNLHHSVKYIVFHAFNDTLGFFGIEAVSLKCRFYPCEDLGELSVLYSDA